MEKTRIIKKDLLVLVFDTKTGKVSTDGGPFRELQINPNVVEHSVPKPPDTPKPPTDGYVCARQTGDTPAGCKVFQVVSGVFYDTGISCANHPSCQIIP